MLMLESDIIQHDATGLKMLDRTTGAASEGLPRNSGTELPTLLCR